jgi:hypothetical protein
MKKEFKGVIYRLVYNISEFKKELNSFEQFQQQYSNDDITEKEFTRIEVIYNECVRGFKSEIPIDMDYIYSNSIENNYFYFDCPLQVYENYFEKRFNDFKATNIDAQLIDFVKSEISYLKYPLGNREISILNDKVPLAVCYGDLILENDSRYEITLTRKFEFISSKIMQLGYKIKIHEGDWDESFGFRSVFGVLKPLEIGAHLIDDYSKNNQLTTNQIVLLLQEIGFFTHPKIEDASKVKQANLISLISGLNNKNIKTNINKLDQSQSSVTTNYRKDIDKINTILDDLI